MRTKWTGNKEIPRCRDGNHAWKRGYKKFGETCICAKCRYDALNGVYI